MQTGREKVLRLVEAAEPAEPRAGLDP